MKILFVFAHPDDESFGPAGTICKLADAGNEVTVVSLCNGARPGSNQVAKERQQAFAKACKRLGVKHQIGPWPDCSLTYDDTLKSIEDLIKTIQPEIVYTNNISDIHRDHRLVAECAMVACRPKAGSIVKELYFCEIPASTSWSFNQIHPRFAANVYEDISNELPIKESILHNYKTETYEWPDARSIEAVITLAEQRGYESGFKAAEAFQLVFALHQRTP